MHAFPLWIPRPPRLRAAAGGAAMLAFVLTAVAWASADAARLRLTLDERTASMIGQEELPVRETLTRGLRVNVGDASAPVQLALFVATLREGRVASVWWSPAFRAAPGVSRLPGSQYLPGEQYLAGDQFLQGALHLPADQYLQGALHVPANQYSPSRGYGSTSPDASIVPESIAGMAETAVVHGRRIDWRRQQVLYLALVPVDGSDAGTRTLGVAFAVPMPDL